MDARHKWVIPRIAELFHCKLEDFEQFVSDQGLESEMTKFFQDPNQKKMLFYQKGEAPNVEFFAQIDTEADSLVAPLVDEGTCVYVIRRGNKPIQTANFEFDLIVGSFQSNYLLAFVDLLKNIMIPALDAQETWGETSKQEVGNAFLYDTSRFATNMETTAKSLECVVQLTPPDLDQYPVDNDPNSILEASKNLDIIQYFEGLVQDWSKTIERTLVQSDQVRREGDEVGPDAELEYWKQRMARFNMITDQLKRDEYRIVLLVLQQAQSKSIKEWSTLDSRATDAANEARDNVRSLYTLDRFIQPLYTDTPPQLLDSVPNIIKAIKMMHSVARYYTTSEQMTALFVKIANQMIICCKKYLTEEGDIWKQDRKSFIARLHACIDLRDSYKEHYHRTKMELQVTPQAKQFDMSEASIFGNFDQFCKRVQKIEDVILSIDEFSSFKKTTLESMQPLLRRLDEISELFQRKTYDVLNYRKDAFDTDYLDFCRSSRRLEEDFLDYIVLCFDNVHETHQAIRLLKHFEAITTRQTLRNELSHQWERVFVNFGHDLEEAKERFESQRSNPPIARNMPPVTGNIQWSRQLLRHIEEPMLEFRSRPGLLQHSEAKHIVRLYNKLAQSLLEFETHWHLKWFESVENALSGLNVTLLVKHPKSGKLYVNLDPALLELIRESKFLHRMQLEVVPEGLLALQREDKLKFNQSALQNLIERRTTVLRRILPIYRDIITPHILNVEEKMAPALKTINWNSLSIDSYITTVGAALDNLDELLSRANEIVYHRISTALWGLGNMELISLPPEPCSLPELVLGVEEFTSTQGDALEVKNKETEAAVLDMIRLILSTLTRERQLTVKDAAVKIYTHFQREAFQMLLRAVIASLHQVSDWTQSYSSGLFELTITLDGDRVNITPSLSEIKRSLVNVSKMIIATTKKVYAWAGLNSSSQGSQNPATGSSTPSSSSSSSAPLPSSSSSTPDSGAAEGVTPGAQATFTTLSPEGQGGEGLSTISTASASELFDVISSGKEVASLYRQMPSTGRAYNSPGQQTPSMRHPPATSSTPMSPSTPSTLTRSNSVGLITPFAGNVDQYYIPEPLFDQVASHKDVIRCVLVLSHRIKLFNNQIEAYLETFEEFKPLWAADMEDTIGEFVKTKPTLERYQEQVLTYDRWAEKVNNIESQKELSVFLINSQPIKDSLIELINEWKTHFAQHLHQTAFAELRSKTEFMTDNLSKLGRPVHDIDDIRDLVKTMDLVREMSEKFDLELGPLEEMYALLGKFGVEITTEETDMLDNLNYRWKKLKTKNDEVMDYLRSVQEKYMEELKENVKAFKAEEEAFAQDYDENGPMRQTNPRTAMEKLRVYQTSFDDKDRKRVSYTEGEILFGLEKTRYENFERIRVELNHLHILYSLYSDVMITVNRYDDTLWVDLNLEEVELQMSDFQSKCRGCNKRIQQWDAYKDLKRMVDEFADVIETLKNLKQEFIRERHWQAIMQVCGTEFKTDPDVFKLGHLRNNGLVNHIEEIDEIANGCAKEAEIETKLNEIIAQWIGKEFTFMAFKNRGELMLKGTVTMDMLAEMEDSQMALQSLLSNRFNGPFKERIVEWNTKLTVCHETIDQWIAVQALWLYLEAVFNGGDIATQLPQAARLFQTIDKAWVKLMDSARDKRNIVAICCSDDTLKTLLPHLTEQLESCQKSLSGYLETKRSLFPRFYFVSDPNLLEILGQATDPNAIQPQLKNIFDNIARVDFDRSRRSNIIGMNSSEKEHVDLVKRVVAEGHIEHWLQSLVEGMRATLRAITKDCVVALDSMELEDFIAKFPAQIALLGIQLLWTRDCDLALRAARTDKNALNNCNKKNGNILKRLVEMTTKELSSLDRTKIETLVTIDVHQRDVFDDLVKIKIRSPHEFNWLKQTRFYWKSDEQLVQIQITDIEFNYCYEYLGCTDRLVVTPLTDRCYITLAQALGMFLGGAPAGPAGTGKTETVKDMGKALGKYVVVFNCSDQMDYRGLGKIFKGLAQSGSWGDFDEFNRIEPAVLSVVAQQVSCILTALRERRTSFVFTDGTTVPLLPTCGYFITMNPGYAGRVELPENLKAVFRSVAMMVPDRQIIQRVKLAAAGFQENIILAKKFYILYRLCEEQLSQQRHYDFGLRNILAVLRTCGQTKRMRPKDNESQILMRVVRDMNLSKLVDEDGPLFNSLINDLFPGLEVKQEPYPDLEKGIQEEIEKAGLIMHPSWYLKIIQLHETISVRHGVFIMGVAGSGKTKCIQMLAKGYGHTGMPHKETRLNPKAITATQMFGKLDVATNEWFDGIFSTIWRKACKKDQEYIWLTLDGPVDALWIESMNTVLDDNKTLTLANSDRIRMTARMKMLFEVGNLDNASPATVSRGGMIFLSRSTLGWLPEVQSRIAKRNDAPILEDLFVRSVDKVFQFIEKNCNEVMGNEPIAAASSTLDILQGLIPSDMNPTPQQLERFFVFSLIWSVGGRLEQDGRVKLHKFLQDTIKLDLPPMSKEGDTVYDYLVDEKSGEWIHWNERVPDYTYPRTYTPAFSSLFIPTVDNVRSEFLIRTIAKQHKQILCIGESGTAKTVTIMNYLETLDKEVMLSKVLNFSSATTPIIFQRCIESLVDKRIGVYGPPGGRKMTIFVDDVNMPEYNEWNDQVTNELFRQLVEEHGFYNLDKPGTFTDLVDLQFICAMPHPGGGHNDIPPRFRRHFNIFNFTMPSRANLKKIFGTIIEGHFCAERKFTQEVIDVAQRICIITYEMWEITKAKMLPTPAKFHYIFNLRDMSRIFQGMIRAESDIVKNTATFLQLWRHECCRVMPDKFVSKEDVDWFDKAMRDLVQKEFSASMANEVMKLAHWVDFMRDAPDDDEEMPAENADGTAAQPALNEPQEPHIYEPVFSHEQLKARAEEFMERYNEMNKRSKINIVLFEDAMAHLCRIYRIISTPRGNALLVGVGGSGKQTLTRLAASIAHCKTFQITITRTYNVSNLFDDLKVLYRMAGVEGHHVAFLFTDNEIKEEGFLEYINSILTSGEIPSLFAKDEIDSITSEVRPRMKKLAPKIVDTADNLWKFFIDQVRDNLHIVLCFSPIGDKFRNRARKFPGLISGCTIDWFKPWPKEALLEVAQSSLSEFDIDCTPQVKQQLVDHMSFVHYKVNDISNEYFQRLRRHAYVTPKSYLSFISTYKSMYQRKRSEVLEMKERLKTGLSKLLKANDDIAEMKKELIVQEKELKVAQAKANEYVQVITVQTAAAEKVKTEVQKVKDNLAVEAEKINAQKEEAQRELDAAKPELEEAKEALNQITGGDIATLKKLGSPPNLIMRIMDGVLILRNYSLDVITIETEKDRQQLKPSWGASKVMLQESGLLSSLQNFPKDSITDEQCELLAPYLEMSDFNKDSAKQACGNMAGLCSWISAMVRYHFIAKNVEPKMKALIEAESIQRKTQAKLDEAEKELAEKQRALDEMQAQYDAAMAEKQKLQDKADLTRRRMDAANSLITGLAGEQKRWKEEIEQFDEDIKKFVGDVCLASSFLCYSGPFNSEYREILQDEWLKDLKKRQIPIQKDLSLTKFCADEPTVAEWNAQGLPTDDLSIQNGIIITTSDRYPLLIDPQGQGRSWILNKEKDLKVTTLNHKYFRNHLEEAVSLGKSLLIEDIQEELDPVLDYLLEKQFVKAGAKSFTVRIGDKDVDYDKNFKLFMTSKLPNPHFSPEICARTSVVDFTVTMKGLEQQILGLVIEKERSDLEEQRHQVLNDVAANKKMVQQYERDLLYKLSESKGNLLDDEEMIAVLRNTKKAASEVAEKLAIGEITEAKINEAREEYRPVATRASILYFLIGELTLVNSMYNTSLAVFLRLFELSMERSEKSPLASKRIENIINYATYHIFVYVSRGLFSNHKILYALQMALKIEMQSGRITRDMFNVLIKGGAALDIATARPKPFMWIPDDVWLNLVSLSALPSCRAILEQVTQNGDAWKKWYDSESPETTAIPDVYNNLDSFGKLLFVRCWREDRTVLATNIFIKDTLGPQFVNAANPELDETYEESDINIPILFLLSLGSDPTANVDQLSKRLKIPMMLTSMGQGQDVFARRQLQQAMQSGAWVMLQNCHLDLNFMEEIEQLVMTMKSDTHKDFRLFLSTEIVNKFPISLLQLSIKVACESPMGIKAGMARNYNWLSEEMLSVIEKKEWKPLIYAMCFLHTTVVERKRFGPLGWNVPYEFNQSDLSASINFLQTHLYQMDAKKGISWSTVRYMVCEVHYGGRITDDHDRRLMNTYGEVWLDSSIFQPKFRFGNEEAYPIPNLNKQAEYLDYIDKKIPIYDSPLAFGMHPNANITYRNQQAHAILDTILAIQPKEATGQGETPEDIVLHIVENMLKNLPPDFNPQDVRQSISQLAGGLTMPLNIFLKQEIDRMEVVIRTIRSICHDLELAIAGTIVMSATLQTTLTALFDSKVPDVWLRVSWASPTLGYWFGDVGARTKQLAEWMKTGRPKTFWLTGFFNPQGFLTSMRQEITRAHGWALDTVAVTTEVTKFLTKDDVKAPPEEGVYIHGLFLDGAAWDAQDMRLIDSAPKILYSPLNVVWVSATNTARSKDNTIYVCPCYKVPKRTGLNYIFEIDLSTRESPDKWILRGVALLCSKQ